MARRAENSRNRDILESGAGAATLGSSDPIPALPSIQELSKQSTAILPAGVSASYFSGLLVQAGKIPLAPLSRENPVALDEFSGLDAAAGTYQPICKSESLATAGNRTSITVSPGQTASQRFIIPAERVLTIELAPDGDWEARAELFAQGREYPVKSERSEGRLLLTMPRETPRGGTEARLELRNCSDKPGNLRAVEPIVFPLLAGNDSSAGPGFWMRFATDEARPPLRQLLRRALILLRRGDYRRVLRALRFRLKELVLSLRLRVGGIRK